ncbi:hypothetical protein [Megalodesulfovibrio paquesii]
MNHKTFIRLALFCGLCLCSLPGSRLPALAGQAVGHGAPTQVVAESEAPPALPDISGVWEGAVLMSTIRAELVQDPTPINNEANAFSGVVTMQSGSQNVQYHVFGFVNTQAVAGVHPPSGAQFMGSLFSPNELRGTITLKSGQQISLTATRKGASE